MDTLVIKRMEPSLWFSTAQMLCKIASRPNKNAPEEPDMYPEHHSARVCAGSLFASMATHLSKTGYTQEWVTKVRSVLVELLKVFDEGFILSAPAMAAFRVYDRHMLYLNQETRASPMVALFLDVVLERCKGEPKADIDPLKGIHYNMMSSAVYDALKRAFEEGLTSLYAQLDRSFLGMADPLFFERSTGPRVLDMVNYFTILALKSSDRENDLKPAMLKWLKWCLPSRHDVFTTTMQRLLANMKTLKRKVVAVDAFPLLPTIVSEAVKLVAGPAPLAPQGGFALTDQIDCMCTYCAVSNNFFKDAEKSEYFIAVAKSKAPHLRARAKKIVEVETLAEDKLKFTKKIPAYQRYLEQRREFEKTSALAAQIRALDDSAVLEPAPKRQKTQ
jgi:hypothetical protein